MALSDAKVRCSDVERQLEDVRAELEMRWLKTSQECELEKQEKKKLTSKLLEIEEELARTNEQLEDVRAEVLKSAQDGESLQKQWLRTLQDGELEKQEKRELKREVKFKLSEMEEELTRILEEMQTASKLQIECQSRFENELHEQKEEQSRMQVCLGEMQLELDKTYQEKKELEKQREQRDEMTSESNAKLMNFQKQLDAMKKDLEESQEAKRLLKEQLDEIQLMGLEETCGQYLLEKQELGTQLDEVASNLARKEQELMYAEKERDEKAEIAGRVETLSQRLVEVVKSGKKVEEELQEVQHSLANNVMQREAAQTELQTNKTVMTAFRSVFNYTDYTIQRLLHDLDAMKKVLDESYEFEKSIVYEFLREKQELTKQLDEFTSNLAQKEQGAQKERDEISAGRVKTPSHRLVEVVECGKKVEVELQMNKTEISVVRSVSNQTENTLQRGLHDLDAMKELDKSYDFQKSIMRQIEETGAARAAAEYSLLFL